MSPPRPLARHDAFDLRSAIERASGEAACFGMVAVLGGDEDPVLLAECSRCGAEMGLLRADLARFELPGAPDDFGWRR